MTPIDGYSLDLPGMSRYFALPGVDDLEGQASIEPMCRAFAALGPLVRPLSIDSLLHAFRRDEQDAVALPRPFWFIAEAEAAALLGLVPSTGGDPAVRHVDALTPAALAGVMGEALAANPVPEHVVITWEESGSMRQK